MPAGEATVVVVATAGSEIDDVVARCGLVVDVVVDEGTVEVDDEGSETA
jgi:hypothetical protein